MKKFYIIIFWISIIIFFIVVAMTSEPDWHCAGTDEECAREALG